MEVIPIVLPEGVRVEAVPEVIEQSISALGLIMAMRSTLKAYPGSIHWHVRRPNHSGTLEITYDPTTQRAWFSTRAGRTKDWVMEAMEKLVIEINRQSALRSQH